MLSKRMRGFVHFVLACIASMVGIVAALCSIKASHLNNNPAPATQQRASLQISAAPQVTVTTDYATTHDIAIPQAAEVQDKAVRYPSKRYSPLKYYLSPSQDQDQQPSYSIDQIVAVDSVAGTIQRAHKIAKDLIEDADWYRNLKGREAAFEVPIKERTLQRILADISFFERHQPLILSVASNDGDILEALKFVSLKSYYSNELVQMQR